MAGSVEVPSDEADANQLRIAREEGAAYQKALKYMVEEVADNGAMQEAGDYRIGIAQEEAEGMYRLVGEGQLEWREPQGENCHLEVSVSDAGDHRFIPGLKIEVTLTPKSGGSPVGPVQVPLLWHPGLYHYGADLTVPGDGAYDIKVVIAPAEFMRHDKQNGGRYSRTVEVTFSDFEIKTGSE
jgi:hypothetical protein